MSTLVVSAFGIHTGGGLVLLRALMEAVGDRLEHAFLDVRALDRLSTTIDPARLTLVPPTVLARLRSLNAAPLRARDGMRLLCFNSLPPLTRSRARTITFVHSAHFAGMAHGIRYERGVVAQHWSERVLFRRGLRFTDELWVQTPTMAAALQRAGGPPVRVIPFVDDALSLPAPAPTSTPRPARFFYPSDALEHKNHARLLSAWALLASQDVRPQLILTLTRRELDAKLRTAGLDATGLAHVDAGGVISRPRVLELMREVDAVIFPSLMESFGLPLVEAAATGSPVLASERDYVRDVCVPAITFDPLSPRSIADAVLRFLGAPRPVVRSLDPAAFVAELLA